MDNCTMDFVSLNDVEDTRFRGSGGSMLFLPAQGLISEDGWHPGFGYYWSSTLEETDNQEDAYFLYFDKSNNFNVQRYTRSHGMPVRPVAK